MVLKELSVKAPRSYPSWMFNRPILASQTEFWLSRNLFRLQCIRFVKMRLFYFNRVRSSNHSIWTGEYALRIAPSSLM